MADLSMTMKIFLASVVLPVLATSAPPMKLKMLDEDLAKASGAQCLDHSAAGYYIRHQDPKKWVIFLEGGGLCVEAIDCIARKDTHLGSSKHWDPSKLPEGSSTCAISDLNPFVNFSHVWVPYCSGDTWLGNSAEAHITLLGLQMSGHLIIQTILEELLNTTTLASATDVILSGSSAGGIGVYHHIDWFSDTLRKRAAMSKVSAQQHDPPRVVGLPISGMFFAEKLPVEFEQWAVGNTYPVSGIASKYLDLLQDSWLHPGCVQAAKLGNFSSSLCFDVSQMLPYTRTPLFIAQNRFDQLQIHDLGVCLSCDRDTVVSKPTSWAGGYTRFFGARVNETMLDIKRKLPQTGLFVPSEFQHDSNFYQFFFDKPKSINGLSLRAAFEKWYWDKADVTLIEATCVQDGPCQDSAFNDIPVSAQVSTVVV